EPAPPASERTTHAAPAPPPFRNSNPLASLPAPVGRRPEPAKHREFLPVPRVKRPSSRAPPSNHPAAPAPPLLPPAVPDHWGIVQAPCPTIVWPLEIHSTRSACAPGPTTPRYSPD